MFHHNRLFERAVIVWLVLLFVDPTPVQACVWDTETLLQERSRFPTALEIIVGKFPRHSNAYYHWRLTDRQDKLKDDPNNDALLDDIAVSYEKLGRYDDAISVATEQLRRSPDRYESLANLGTFLIHRGELRDGLKFLERAIEVNPDAHFGREKYQVILVQYILSRSNDGSIQLPLASERIEGSKVQYSFPFYEFLVQHASTTPDGRLSKQDIENAIKGILGMMRFSRHDSPILLEVLGELQEALSAGQLAYRSYMSASLNVDDPQARARYTTLANNALEWSRISWREAKGVEVSQTEIAEDFQAELADALLWYQGLVEDEHQWIAAGEAVDQRFNEKYREIPQAIVTDPETERDSSTYDVSLDYTPVIATITSCVFIIILILATLSVVWARSRWAMSDPTLANQSPE